MATRMAMTVVLATVFGLGMLAGAGLATPWKQTHYQAQNQRAATRPADAARAEAVFAAHWRAAAEGRSPAQPLPLCPACIQAVAGQGRDESAARAQCAAACGIDE